MSNYSQINDYSAKDALATGNPEKLILGSDIDDELAAISVAVATKYDSADLASQAQAEAETVNTVLMTPLRVANWADYNAGIVGDLQGIADPNADVILGWDDSAGAAIGFTLSTGLTTSGTNLLIDTAVVPRLSAANTYTSTAAYTHAGDSNEITFTETGNSVSWFLGTGTTNGRLGTSSNHAFKFYTNNTEVGSISAAGVWTLNGVNVTDYARLSQANTFLSANQAISATSNPNLTITDGGGVSTRIITVTSESGGRAGTSSNHQFALETNSVQRMVISNGGNFDFKGGAVTTNNASASEVGYKGVPYNTQSGSYTCVLADAGSYIRYTGGGGHTLTIPANSSVAYPIGTVLTFATVGNGTTIAITSDTMYWGGVGSTGSRTLAAKSIATALKIASTEWIISGAGLS